MTDPVRAQYERFPYPPVSALALPRRGQGAGLAYELGRGLAVAQGYDAPADHAGMRILVAGAGTLEALVVAQVHPRAAEVVAVDFSAASIARLRRRAALTRLSDTLHLRGLFRRARAPLRCVRADLRDWEGGAFDYVLVSNVLHHVADPAALLRRLAGWLQPGGLLRMVTYPKAGRFWIREVSSWLRLNGLSRDTPNLARRAHACIAQLPADHPVRACFEAHSESATATGIADAFLHACENPLSPLEWRAAASGAGLMLAGESQREDSRSGFLDALAPAAAALDPWEKLQVLDDLLELATNPVLWFVHRPTAHASALGARATPRPAPVEQDVTESGFTLTLGVTPKAFMKHASRGARLPSLVYWHLGEQLRHADALLGGVGVSVAEVVARLRGQAGPRIGRAGRELPGLAISDYDTGVLLAAPQPWGAAQWQALERHSGGTLRLCVNGEPMAGANLAAQAAWAQCRYGATQEFVGIELRG